MRIPATDEQKDFDELIMGLTKILIDSLNEKYLNKMILPEQRANLKGSISILEAAIDACGVVDAKDHISFLRKLQNFRSSSAAHRKGSNYKKIAIDFGVDSQNLRSVFSEILQQAINVIKFFISVVRSGNMQITE